MVLMQIGIYNLCRGQPDGLYPAPNLVCTKYFYYCANEKPFLYVRIYDLQIIDPFKFGFISFFRRNVLMPALFSITPNVIAISPKTYPSVNKNIKA